MLPNSLVYHYFHIYFSSLLLYSEISVPLYELSLLWIKSTGYPIFLIICCILCLNTQSKAFSVSLKARCLLIIFCLPFNNLFWWKIPAVQWLLKNSLSFNTVYGINVWRDCIAKAWSLERDCNFVFITMKITASWDTEQILEVYRMRRCNMSLKIHFLHSYLNSVSNKPCRHQQWAWWKVSLNIFIMVKHFHKKWNLTMLLAYNRSSR